jgi:predicted phosphodiesterase
MQPDQTGQHAGRFCPADYRINPQIFARSTSTPEFDVVYVVGGLYGNTEALKLICQAFDAEPNSRKCMVFNGDFHWFDVADAEFIEIEKKASQYVQLRGNVETELARHVAVGESDIGCGCAYPDDVPAKDVDYSNKIIQQLRATYQRLRTENSVATNLSDLPMAMRVQVGGLGIAVTHGDIDSLAGWSLAHNRIESTLATSLGRKLHELAIDVVASSHTCLPALHRRNGKLIVNNGAAGLGNFQSNTAGLVTRISKDNEVLSLLPIEYKSELKVSAGAVNVQALSVPFDDVTWQRKFLAQWPSASAAHESYWKRIQQGTSYSVKQAMQYEL